MKNDFIAIGNFCSRNMKLYFKDKMGVFFSILAPLIIFLLYVLFLGDIQKNAMIEICNGMNIVFDTNEVSFLCDSWMISGVLGISCVTVALSNSLMIVKDETSKVNNDFKVSTDKSYITVFGYLLSNFIVTFCIVFIILLVGIIYFGIFGQVLVTFAEFFEIVANLFISVISAVLVTNFVASFFKSINAFNGMVGIFSAVGGFLIGAYMPLSTLPNGVQNLSAFMPATSSTGIFRNILMQRRVDAFASNNKPLFEAISKSFSLDINFFDYVITKNYMYIFIFVSIVLFLIMNIIRYKFKKR